MPTRRCRRRSCGLHGGVGWSGRRLIRRCHGLIRGGWRRILRLFLGRGRRGRRRVNCRGGWISRLLGSGRLSKSEHRRREQTRRREYHYLPKRAIGIDPHVSNLPKITDLKGKCFAKPTALCKELKHIIVLRECDAIEGPEVWPITTSVVKFGHRTRRLEWGQKPDTTGLDAMAEVAGSSPQWTSPYR